MAYLDGCEFVLHLGIKCWIRESTALKWESTVLIWESTSGYGNQLLDMGINCRRYNAVDTKLPQMQYAML